MVRSEPYLPKVDVAARNRDCFVQLRVARDRAGRVRRDPQPGDATSVTAVSGKTARWFRVRWCDWPVCWLASQLSVQHVGGSMYMAVVESGRRCVSFVRPGGRQSGPLLQQSRLLGNRVDGIEAKNLGNWSRCPGASVMELVSG